MKVSEIIGEQQLDEINLRGMAKHATAVGIVGAAMMGSHKGHEPAMPAKQEIARTQQVPTPSPKKELDEKTKAAIARISKLYGTDPEFAKEVIELAKKYQKPGFPTAKDIIAIIAVESEFDPDAESGLKHDKAVGLMQIRPHIWNLDPDMLKDPEQAVRIGSDILHKYYRHLHGNKDAALQAYNVGLSNFQQGEENPNYVNKFYTRLKHIDL